MAEQDEKRVAVLIKALDDDKVSVRWNVIRELGRMGEAGRDAMPALTALLEDRDGTTALWARVALARITSDVDSHLPHLLEALQTKRRVFPGMAAAALGELGAASAPALSALAAELKAPHADDRWSAAGALAAIGNGARQAVPALAEALEHDADEKVRWYAAYALSEIGSGSAPAALALLRAMDDGDEDVRGYAARALGRIGLRQLEEQGQRAAILARLRELLEIEEGTVRSEMEQALSLLEAGKGAQE